MKLNLLIQITFRFEKPGKVSGTTKDKNVVG
jgi:hypothetical protein